ncbi:Rad1-domain-containing protein [Auriscalpium vulgare]|uniref:Rad1-domain-containing protein n=1 Tax=Auriscalpium vulgare TaxID=40419 RepID=A0ACB8RDA8_9AGAM|nr:Rad1-domain-containing protein [Auriscalpium vulgare]
MLEAVDDEEERIPPVLTSSLHDIRYFSSLLRGVNFANRATVTITASGFTVQVEEARTIIATAYIFADIFDEYTYSPPAPDPPSHSQSQPTSSPTPPPSSPSDAPTTALEIPLGTFIECLNIFGTANAGAGGAGKGGKRWRRPGEEDDGDGGADGRAARIQQFFTGGEKRTGMRMSYMGEGHPLTLLVAEDAAGPTAKCEVTTYEAEPMLDLPFDSDQTVLKIILKSSWLRDALSELDQSTDKLTFVGNPPVPGQARARTTAKPIFRIEAIGTYGSTEMDYPNDRDVLETVECPHPVNFSYRYSHISKALKALGSSAKTSLRIDEDGLLSLQFLMPSPKPRGGTSQAFVEFRCLPLDETI